MTFPLQKTRLTIIVHIEPESLNEPRSSETLGSFIVQNLAELGQGIAALTNIIQVRKGAFGEPPPRTGQFSK